MACLPKDHDLHVAQLFNGLCQNVGGRQRVGAIEGRVGDQDGLVAAHGQAGLEGFLGAFGAKAEGRGFAAVLLLEADGLFDGIFVPGVDHQAGVAPGDLAAVNGDLGGRVGGLFDADDDVHRLVDLLVRNQRNDLCSAAQSAEGIIALSDGHPTRQSIPDRGGRRG